MRHPVFSEIIAMHATDGLADSFCGESLSDQKCVDLLAFRGIRFFRVVIFLSQKSEDLGRLVHLHILKDHLHQIVADARPARPVPW